MKTGPALTALTEGGLVSTPPFIPGARTIVPARNRTDLGTTSGRMGSMFRSLLVRSMEKELCDWINDVIKKAMTDTVSYTIKNIKGDGNSNIL